tara:strand:- start:102 stop:278 length:177 start_codon:yes stop_codon:yes gene_type:complete
MKKKEVKRAEAIERNDHWASMSPGEQLAHLDKYNFTAKKQRAKIAAVMATPIKKNKKK